MKPLYIIGSGGFSKQVIEIVNKINNVHREYDLVGIIDDNLSLLGKSVLDYEVVGDTDYLQDISQNREVNAVIAIGQGSIREKIYNKLSKVNWVNLIHPSTIISKYISIGKGNIICGGVIINPDCKIGNHCNINIGCTLGHDVILQDFSTLMPACNVSGNVVISKASTIGTGSCIIQNILVEENSIVGAGAVVIKDVDKNSVYVGVPARKVKGII
ncbi:acetyltransferase [Proteiniborus sp.]|uniref:acetyltransferase n=1 Tax=Proteiniborus sp. TaxID=2079015 RepID=UPI003332262F